MEPLKPKRKSKNVSFRRATGLLLLLIAGIIMYPAFFLGAVIDFKLRILVCVLMAISFVLLFDKPDWFFRRSKSKN